MKWLENLKFRWAKKDEPTISLDVTKGRNEPFRHYCEDRSVRPCGCKITVNVDGTVREVFINAFPNRATRRRQSRLTKGRVVSK